MTALLIAQRKNRAEIAVDFYLYLFTPVDKMYAYPSTQYHQKRVIVEKVTVSGGLCWLYENVSFLLDMFFSPNHVFLANYFVLCFCKNDISIP